MFVQGLDHVNVRVKDPDATFAFFQDILGMTVRRSESGSVGGGGMLLDTQGNAILHIGSAYATYPTDKFHPFSPEQSGGAVHHVAIACSGYEAVQEILDKNDVSYRSSNIPEMNLRQIFVVEPGGVLLELNFRNS